MFRNMSLDERQHEVRPRILDDPRTLRALAHPTRIDLLELLGREGELTATQAGHALGLTPANCSYHLRQLARHGFVREAEGSGRNRPWQLASLSHSWSDVGPDGQTSPAASALTGVVLDREFARIRSWFARQAEVEKKWRDAAFATTSLAYLTAEELAELQEQVSQLLLPRVNRITDRSARPPGARPVGVLAVAYLLDPTASGA
jgi:DNA-binding transcriptional ArsR family regulator